ncbi:proton-conducting transporter transmembrane domain-containing protein [Nonomuraea sediminis]|uniref:proton-conducting transporter transmembrane domain-containing protein n=1 Tax=Nonomuraea sediminis TaxID=2835864 RepID=UPI001BDCBBC2|nr:proton-conducting transporter membrane subunit [Nonomuraea sediminis]
MTLYAWALGLCLFATLPGLVRGLGTAGRILSGVVLAAAGGCAAVAGCQAMLGHGWSAWLPWLLPLSGVRLALDPLGGLFTAITGAVTLCAAVYGIGHRPGRGRAVIPLFVAGMLLVPAAASVSTFLACWELMAVTSLVLVLAEHRERPEVARAGLWYGVMTQLGLASILCGLCYLAAEAGGESFDQLRAAALSPAERNVIFLATLLGFASKAGIVPLHVWLPRAYPEAPSPAAALMSGAMVNLGVYGLVRVGLDLLRGGPGWWWWIVLALGALSALYGVLQAAMATDVKRLLGYSSTENMGLVLIGVGAAGFFAADGATLLAGLALTAGLLHVVNHAAFKTLLFQAAGSVQQATGTRDLDALGGLRERMPYTTALFAVGAICASALPPGNGFVSEWLLLQGLIHALPSSGVAGAVTMPLAVGAIALSAGLAVATFVKAFGIGFLARPRGAGAERAAESPRPMVWGMGLAAAACLFLALNPTLVAPTLAGAVGRMIPGEGAVAGEVTVRLTRITASISPLLIAFALCCAVAGLAVLVRLVAARRPRRVARLWDCGAGPMPARTEYTATSFAEPLQRVFVDALQPESAIDVVAVEQSGYLVEHVDFRSRVPDRVERRLYEPVLAAVTALGRRARRLADGSVHRYLSYGFYALTGVLIVLAVIS